MHLVYVEVEVSFPFSLRAFFKKRYFLEEKATNLLNINYSRFGSRSVNRLFRRASFDYYIQHLPILQGFMKGEDVLELRITWLLLNEIQA